MFARTILVSLALASMAFSQDPSKSGKPSQADIDKAIDTGAEFLKKQQKPDGSWEMSPSDIAMHAFKDHMGPQTIGHTALNLLTVLVADINPDDPCIARGFKYLADHKSEYGHTYNCGLSLMAIEAHAEKRMMREAAKPGFRRDKIAAFRKLPASERELAEELTKRLVLGQNEDGSWTYAARQGEVGTGTKSKMVMGGEPQDPPQGLPPGLPQPGQGLPPGLPPGFPGGEPPAIGGDLSNTQYALLGLRAAAELGIKFNQEAWWKAKECLLNRQEKSGAKVKPFRVPAATDEMGEGKKGPAIPRGTHAETGRPEFEARGWGYSPSLSRPESYGAMSCIGIASLVMCKYYLKGYKAFKPDAVDRVNKGIEDGCAWLAANFNAADNAKWQDPHVPYKNTAPKIDGYTMYGIERAGVLAGVERFGEHDWYALGARVLVDRQQSDGSWSSEMFYEPKPTISTCFAILFLKRATEPVIETGDKQK